MKTWFNNWENFKAVDGTYNFGRTSAAFMMIFGNIILIISIIMCLVLKIEITNVLAILICSPYITGVILFLLEVVRENKRVSLKIGNNELKAES